MNLSDSTSLFTETLKTLESLLTIKGGEYAGSDDRLANFKRGAQLVGITPLQCAFVYASKHYDAIATYVRDDASGRERPRSEGIEGRLDDLMNYCFLMKCIIREQNEQKLLGQQNQAHSYREPDARSISAYQSVNLTRGA